MLPLGIKTMPVWVVSFVLGFGSLLRLTLSLLATQAVADTILCFI